MRYTVISADCHGGADLLEYRDHLDRSRRDEFDAWAAGYEVPYEDLKGEDGTRNWDSDRRLRELEADGIVAEVLFPNTIPPFFSASSLGSQAAAVSAADLDRRWAGLRAHNRWLAGFCAAAPGRRAGVFQVMLHDIDAAVAEVRRSVAAGLRGGLLLPGTPPGSGLPPIYYHDYYDPLWRACTELGVPVNVHSGSAAPRWGDRPEDHVLFMLELRWWDQRTLRQLILGGVLERHPDLKVVFTEEGLGWIPGRLRAMDGFVDSMNASAGGGELAYGAQVARNLSLRPSEYWTRQCYAGASFMHPSESAVRDSLGVETIMWGSDYPHTESSYPFSDAAIRFAYAGVPEDEVELMLGGTAARLFGFDLARLARDASRIGPERAAVSAGVDPATLPAEVAKCPAFAGVTPGSSRTRWVDNRKA
ncbi:amidohydrolase family protein [Actinomadura xylanilytica]|uniref:amidohydrolase family protein n=1 Tax=Actinomadura xylanilytica TaxID=887459 RepID=UPI00255B1EB5|nr:amidohydrolase family protein [Actinomadura xylanilytica]MDL4775336.1 amidohydrolase family protein [Actinomadura xylanilytica]